MKTLNLPGLCYGGLLMLTVSALYAMQLGVALCVPKVAPANAASASRPPR